MSVVITASGNHGPYKSIEVLDDRLRCDGTDLPFSVIGEYTISEDDSLAPQPPGPPLTPLKATLTESVDAKIAGIYNRWLRFEAEYVAREAAARAFKAADYSGDPGVWVTSFSSNAGLSNQTAADLIIGQADGLRTALQALGALRMAKYGISAASTVAGAQAAHDSIIAQADAIAAAL